MLPEMVVDENDKSTPTVSRGPKTFNDDECCKCPSTKSVDETSSDVDETDESSTDVEEDETTTELPSTESDNSTMKDRDARQFGDNSIENEIDTTTPKETSEAPKDTSEAPTDSDDLDAASRKTSIQTNVDEGVKNPEGLSFMESFSVGGGQHISSDL